MRETYKKAVAKKFNRLDFHDDNLKLVTIHLPRAGRNLTSIEFEFEDRATRTAKVLSFHGCANLRSAMDFDVLAANWFAETEGSTAETNARKMRKFVTTQKSHWRTTYMPPQPKDKPIRMKLSSMRSYVLFKVKLFGGTVEILAKRFKLK